MASESSGNITELKIKLQMPEEGRHAVKMALYCSSPILFLARRNRSRSLHYPWGSVSKRNA